MPELEENPVVNVIQESQTVNKLVEQEQDPDLLVSSDIVKELVSELEGALLLEKAPEIIVETEEITRVIREVIRSPAATVPGNIVAQATFLNIPPATPTVVGQIDFVAYVGATFKVSIQDVTANKAQTLTVELGIIGGDTHHAVGFKMGDKLGTVVSINYAAVSVELIVEHQAANNANIRIITQKVAV